MSGAIVDLSRERSPGTVTADVCVIGSGCAGATAAWVLAEAGRDVVVLEEGGDFTGTALTQRDGEMYDQLYMERGGRATEDLAVSVLQARVLGGGGVINASDVVPAPDGVLRHWVRRHGLTDLSPEALAPYRERALEDLSATEICEYQLNEANKRLREGTRALGWQGAPMMHNREGCMGLGTCLIGCPINAKRNPRFVAVPGALEAGARFFLRVRAARIEGANGEVKTVVARTLDERGYRECGDLRVRAKVVIVAANAVATPHLLLRSGIGNEHVGRHLTLQPQLPVVAEFEAEIEAFRGIPQSYAVTEFEVEDHPEHGLWGFRIEGIMGTPGIVSTLLPFVGRDAMEAMRAYRRMAGALLLVPDAASGTVTDGPGGRPLVAYAHRDDHKERLRAAARAAARIYLAAGATRVIVPTTPAVIVRSERDLGAIDAVSFAPATAPLISAHQQGSVRMAPSAAQGAADPEGRVYGARDVYVLDSSLFPTSASSHIMTPILTVSRYLAEKIAHT